MQLVESTKTFILAGGVGSRLWPLSSTTTPKQFLKILSSKSMFQQAVLRNMFLGYPAIIVNKDCLDIVKIQLREIDIDPDSADIEIIVEPIRKNTAACVITAAYYAQRHGIKNIIIAPCDHVISTQQGYEDTMMHAMGKLSNAKIIAIAITPDYFSPEYGYIEAIKTERNDYKVKSFIEKPQKRPQGLFDDSKYYFWNSGIYLLDSNYIMSQADKYWSTYTKMIKITLDTSSIDNNVTHLSENFYQNIDDKSFDIIFSQRIARQEDNSMQIVKAMFNWSDVGSWPAMIKKITDTYPLNSRIKHDNLSDNMLSNQIFSLKSHEIYDFAPKILILEDSVAVIHEEYICLANRSSPSQILKMKKTEFLSAQHSNNFHTQFTMAS